MSEMSTTSEMSSLTVSQLISSTEAINKRLADMDGKMNDMLQEAQTANIWIEASYRYKHDSETLLGVSGKSILNKSDNLVLNYCIADYEKVFDDLLQKYRAQLSVGIKDSNCDQLWDIMGEQRKLIDKMMYMMLCTTNRKNECNQLNKLNEALTEQLERQKQQQQQQESDSNLVEVAVQTDDVMIYYDRAAPINKKRKRRFQTVAVNDRDDDNDGDDDDDDGDGDDGDDDDDDDDTDTDSDSDSDEDTETNSDDSDTEVESNDDEDDFYDEDIFDDMMSFVESNSSDVSDASEPSDKIA